MTSSASSDTKSTPPTLKVYQCPLNAPVPLPREHVTAQVGVEPLRPVVELDLVVTGAGHPGSVGCRTLVVVAKVTPNFGLRRRVQVGVAQVSVQEVEERLEGLDGVDGVRALAIGQHPRGIGRGQVSETGEAERCSPLRCGRE